MKMPHYLCLLLSLCFVSMSNDHAAKEALKNIPDVSRSESGIDTLTFVDLDYWSGQLIQSRPLIWAC